MKILLILILGWASSPVFAADEAVVTETQLQENRWVVEPSLGYGTSTLFMRIESQGTTTKYDATNTNYLSLGIAVNEFGLSVKIPTHDTNTKDRGSSSVTDYQVGFPLGPKIRATVFYQDYKGYYAETTSEKREATVSTKPELRFTHVGGQMSYFFNPEYSLAMTESSSWQQLHSAGSWILATGYSKFNLQGDIFADSLVKDGVVQMRELDARVWSLRGGYGYNWLWTHWYTGVQGSLGAALTESDSKYSDGGRNKSEWGSTSCMSFSGGYRWATSRVGLFARGMQWETNLDRNASLTSNASVSGFYYARVF